MKHPISTEELKNKKVGKITTTVIHLILVALLFLNFFTYPDPPPGQDGIEILTSPLAIVSSPENDKSGQDEINEEKEEIVPKKIKEEERPKKQTPKTIDEKVKVNDNSEEIALAKKIKEQKDAQEKAQALEEERVQEEKDREAKANDAKNKNKQLFDNSKNGKPGGIDSDGENPDQGILENLGSGMSLGGGLGNRGVVKAPTFDPVEQVKGKVTIDVCVDETGKVYKAKSTIKNTSITSQAVIKQAETYAKKWKFQKGKKACGTITYILKLK
ncbi:MAG: cell envelope integrity protein TolA [Saprospiraceae bacterium]